MRRAAATLAAVALALSLISVASGLLLARDVRDAVAHGASAVPRAHLSTLGQVHLGAGVAAAVVAAAVASMTFLLGLQGLLESERRGTRIGAAVAFGFGPALMALAVASFVTGRAEWRDVHLGRLRPEPLEAMLHDHGMVVAAGFVGALGVHTLVAAVARARRRREEDEEEED